MSKHIPVPYEQAPALVQADPFPTPVQFGDPLEIGGWKDRRPSWVEGVERRANLGFQNTVRIFNLLEVDMTY